MKVKQKLRINSLVLGLSVIVTVGVLLVGSFRVNRALEASRAADAILAASFERLLLRTDLHRSGSPRSKAQLIAKHAQIGRLLRSALADFPQPEDQRTLEELLAVHDSIGHLSMTIRVSQEKRRSSRIADPVSQEAEERLLSQLNTRVYETILLDNRLQDSAQQALNASLKFAGGGMLLVALIVSLVVAVNSFSLNRFFGGGIKRVRDGAIVIGGGNLDHRIEVKGDDEFSELAQSFNEMAAKLNGSYQELRKEIAERILAEEALRRTHDELEARVEARTAELREKDRLLLLHSRQAAMGEMIGNIAHQWRQPLNSLGIMVQQLLLFYDLGGFNREFLEQNVNKSMELIQHMSATIDDFRNYFRPDKEKLEFKLSVAVAKTLALIEDSFKNEQVQIDVVKKDDPVIFGYQNEYSQVLLNILNNARDAFQEGSIKDRRVTITVQQEDSRAVVTITDNAGGIPEEIIGKIFEPYFTTKGPQYGTGVGLFMAKSIIEKNMGGVITARNVNHGAEFRIEV